jgi:hypothetical protein
MEADLERVKIESETKIKIAEIEAKNRLDIAKKNRRGPDIYWNGVVAGILIVITILGITGAFAYNAVNDSNKKAEQIARCEQAGGTWTPRIQRVYDSARRGGDAFDEWYEICVK